jgi:hypothetical protein
MGENYEKLFFMNTLGKELPTKWRSSMMAPVSNTSRAAGHKIYRGPRPPSGLLYDF